MGLRFNQTFDMNIQIVEAEQKHESIKCPASFKL